MRGVPEKTEVHTVTLVNLLIEPTYSLHVMDINTSSLDK